MAAKALGVGLARHRLVLSPQWAVGGGAFPGDEKPMGFDICWSVDRPDTCGRGTESPGVWLPRAQACPELGYEVGS
jgi:hypothetical protein